MSQQAEDEPMEDFDQFLDSERIEINRVFAELRENIGKHRERSSFQREARERFAEIGFVVRVDFYQSLHEDHLPEDERTHYPEISFLGRCEPVKIGEFDHERMGHEVRSNIIGKKGQDNVQKTQIAPGFSSTKSGLIVPD